MNDPVGLITLSEAARRLRISWASAWRLALTGQIDARQVRGRWFVDPRSVDDVLVTDPPFDIDAPNFGYKAGKFE